MDFDLEQCLDRLARTPRVLDSLLRGTHPALQAATEGPETWSAVEIVAHLIHGEETDWIPRARILLQHGADRPFDSFDRFAHLQTARDASLAEHLDRFAALRRQNLETLRGWNLTAEQLERVGRHPELGTVRLWELIATWVVHDLSHLAQIARVMAKAYTEAVGEWRAYLPILDRVPRAGAD